MSEKHTHDAFAIPQKTVGHEETPDPVVSIVGYWLNNWWKPLFYVPEPLVLAIHNLNPSNPWFALPDHFDEE